MKLTYLILFTFIFGHTILSQEKFKYPIPKKVDVTDDYFGTKVSDPYRWMEDLESPELKEWIDKENILTSDFIGKIPFREKMKNRLTDIWNYVKYSDPFKAGSYYFYYKNDGLQNQFVLYKLKDIKSEPEVFIDPNTFSNDGTIALIDISVSNDNKYIAYSVSKSGSDWMEIYVRDIETNKQLSDHITNVKFYNAAWFKDGFYYGTYEQPKDGNILSVKNQNQKVYYHKLGTDQSQDVLIFEDKNNPEVSSFFWSSEDEKFIFKSVNETAKEGNLLYYKYSNNPESEWTPVIAEYGSNIWPVNNIGDKILFITNNNAPKYNVIAIDAGDNSKNWEFIIPEKEYPLVGIKYAGGKLVAEYMKDVKSSVEVYKSDGKYLYDVTLPGIGTVTGFQGRKNENKVFYTFTSFLTPGTIYIYDIEKNSSALFKKSDIKFNSSEYEEKQVFYSSKDGTKVPMFLVYKKGLKLDGNNPVYLYSYGGFNNSLLPSFRISRTIFLENGGVYAMPNIRGGGEYGEEWHMAAMQMKKQNTFDDFIAAAEYLIKEGYTSSKKLAIAGGSNGGLLIGAVLNQRPDLFAAAIPAVGVMDMLRYQEFTIGSAWVREYGSSRDSKEMFKYLFAYSPLHNIRDDVNYPPVLVMTADHDDRVVPLHSFKYTATLQEKYKGLNPVLIRVDTKSGHGMGKPTSKLIEQVTDEWSFVFYNLGMDVR
jgi:prolyl oligopeptidase